MGNNSLIEPYGIDVFMVTLYIVCDAKEVCS